MTCDEERWFSLWGPSSGGGESIIVRGARVFLVAYGDAAQGPDEARREVTPAELVRAYGHDPRAAGAIAYLRERGLA